VRLIKMFGLATLAASATIAFVGAASAMAENTTLCETDTAELGCAGEIEAEHVHLATLEGSPALLLSTVNIECDVLFLGDALALGAPLVLHGAFTYSNCQTFSGGECKSVTEVSTDSLLEVLKTGEEEAEVTFTGEVLMECIGLHCVYNRKGLSAAAEGSLGSGHAVIEKQQLSKVSGLLCPKLLQLDITAGWLTELFIRN